VKSVLVETLEIIERIPSSIESNPNLCSVGITVVLVVGSVPLSPTSPALIIPDPELTFALN